MFKLNDLIKSTIEGIKSSYPDKYREKDYIEFEMQALKWAKNKTQLVTLVENLFDLDRSDAKDMVY